MNKEIRKNGFIKLISHKIPMWLYVIIGVLIEASGLYITYGEVGQVMWQSRVAVFVLFLFLYAFVLFFETTLTYVLARIITKIRHKYNPFFKINFFVFCVNGIISFVLCCIPGNLENNTYFGLGLNIVFNILTACLSLEYIKENSEISTSGRIAFTVCYIAITTAISVAGAVL